MKRAAGMAAELQKIVLWPFFWLFLLGTLAVNGWLLWNYSGQRELVRESVRAQEELGVLTQDTIPEYCRRMEGYGDGNAERMIRGAGVMAEELEAEDLAAAYTENYRLSGKAGRYAKGQFEELSAVIRKNRENGTANAFFVPCAENFFSLHGRQIPLFCTIESIFLAVFLNLWYLSEPFASRNASLVFSLRKGRKLCRRKRAAGCLAAVLGGGVLWGITLAAADLVFPLGALWNTPVGSMMMLEQQLPLITEVPMTLAQYTAVQFLISLAATAFFASVSGWWALRTRSPLTAAAGLGLVCMAAWTVADVFPTDTLLWFLIRCNPVSFAAEAGHWTAKGALSMSSVKTAAFILVFWGTAAAVMTVWQNIRFGREDI